MVAKVLLRCYQFLYVMIIYGLHTVKSFKATFTLMVILTIYLFYNLCRFLLELSINTLIMIFLSFFKVTFTIYLFYNLCRFSHELSTNILIMIHLPSR